MMECKKCYGRGWYFEFYGPIDQWGVQDYRERYCECPVGRRVARDENLDIAERLRSDALTTA